MATTIRLLKDYHFALQSKDLISLEFDDVILVFFDDRSDLADQIRPIFVEAGEKAAGPIFALCDIKNNDDVATAFFKLRNEPNNPHVWAAQNFPFILVYRNGWPQAFYNGDLTSDLLRKYSMELAGQPTYYEKNLIDRNPLPTNPNPPSSTPPTAQVQAQATSPKPRRGEKLPAEQRSYIKRNPDLSLYSKLPQGKNQNNISYPMMVGAAAGVAMENTATIQVPADSDSGSQYYLSTDILDSTPQQGNSAFSRIPNRTLNLPKRRNFDY